MRVVIIGATGHIGSYLVPRLLDAGHDVVAITRGKALPYIYDSRWNSVETVTIDRSAAEAEGTFEQQIRDLSPDVVVDLINFKPASVHRMVEALEGVVDHYLYCGTIWSHGHATLLPATESLPRKPFGGYGVDKWESEKYLMERYRSHGFPATVIMPGHITGPGWNCIGPEGNLDPDVFTKLAHHQQVALPHFGMETVHHVHADDVAQVFALAIQNRNAALGESFHAVAAQALTLRGFAEAVSAWFGHDDPNLVFQPWDEWSAGVSKPEYARSTYDHIAHSDNYSIEKARRLLGFEPRYTILQAVREALLSMIERGEVTVPGPLIR